MQSRHGKAAQLPGNTPGKDWVAQQGSLLGPRFLDQRDGVAGGSQPGPVGLLERPAAHRFRSIIETQHALIALGRFDIKHRVVEAAAGGRNNAPKGVFFVEREVRETFPAHFGLELGSLRGWDGGNPLPGLHRPTQGQEISIAMEALMIQLGAVLDEAGEPLQSVVPNIHQCIGKSPALICCQMQKCLLERLALDLSRPPGGGDGHRQTDPGSDRGRQPRGPFRNLLVRATQAAEDLAPRRDDQQDH